MLHFRLFLVSAIIAVLLALVQAVPAGEANAPAASAAAAAAPLVSPSIDIAVATAAPTHAAAAAAASNDGPMAHLSLGQVVFNFVAGMLNIVEDTVRGYLQFGPGHN
ncbi:hypothetical protein LPJ53_001608 [Coemansia erecta]|uniref:Secreted protein n=1 Tax=Coemansia erecta TaxID=147472 RepID=A0A9W7Y3X1_9FUNG|nr:hypothetical protein LPJ53_001608 [Coemansia erecta]